MLHRRLRYSFECLADKGSGLSKISRSPCQVACTYQRICESSRVFAPGFGCLLMHQLNAKTLDIEKGGEHVFVSLK